MPITCRICESTAMALVKPSNIGNVLTSQDFAITDSRYGVTGELHRCKECGFLQCTNLEDVLSYYENLEDPSYETGRKERAIQARKILETVQKFCSTGRLLDIGAGSGILVEQAIKMGFNVDGIEPSRWLQNQAKMVHQLPVHLGTFPHPHLSSRYDVITIIDVIEHVPDPIQLLTHAGKVLAPNGIVVVVTPDVNSLMARLLRWRWWHFRIAHIGYFNQNNLNIAATKAGFKLVYSSRPSWYFTADYLFERVMTYVPKFLRLPTPPILSKITIPLNLFDSLLCVYALNDNTL